MRKVRAVAIGVACAAATQAAAFGAGPSPGVMQGRDGIARGNVRYVAVPGLDTTTLYPSPNPLVVCRVIKRNPASF